MTFFDRSPLLLDGVRPVELKVPAQDGDLPACPTVDPILCKIVVGATHLNVLKPHLDFIFPKVRHGCIQALERFRKRRTLPSVHETRSFPSPVKFPRSIDCRWAAGSVPAAFLLWLWGIAVDVQLNSIFQKN